MDLQTSLDYGLTLLAALLIGTGFVLQQQTAQAEPESRFLSLRLIGDLLRQRRWLAGIGCMIGGQVLAAWSIGNLSLAFVEPLLTTNLVFALLLAVPIAKASLRAYELFGALVLLTGVALLSAARSAKPIGLSFGSFTHWPAAAVIAGIALACVHFGRLRSGRSRATLTGIAAGLIFGIQDALTRQALQILSHHGIGAMFTTWAPYALVGAGAIGIWLMQSAFNAGPLPQSLPAIAAGEPLVGIMLGIVVFGDRIQVSPGELALQAGGIAALVVGVILVGRAPALSQLRAWTDSNLPHVPLNLPSRPGLPGRPGRYAAMTDKANDSANPPGDSANLPGDERRPGQPDAPATYGEGSGDGVNSLTDRDTADPASGAGTDATTAPGENLAEAQPDARGLARRRRPRILRSREPRRALRLLARAVGLTPGRADC